MKAFRIIGVLLLVLLSAARTEAGEDPDLKKVETALRPVLAKLEPAAEVTYPDSTTSLIVSYRVQQYKIHPRSKSGAVFPETRDETGPSFEGFILKAHLQNKGEINQAETPQTLREPYWQTYLDVTPLAGTEKQIYWALLYGSRTDEKLLAQIKAVLGGLTGSP